MAAIWIVEDNSTIVTLVETGLVLHHFRVRSFSCGEDFLTAFAEPNLEPPDLLLLDLLLPGTVSGFDILEKLMKRSQGPKIIVTSGYLPELEDIQFAPSKRIAFLPKPFTKDQLLRDIESMLTAEADAPASGAGVNRRKTNAARRQTQRNGPSTSGARESASADSA